MFTKRIDKKNAQRSVLLMEKIQRLLARLDEIGKSLEKSGRGLALIGLGSVGAELTRLDEYSDLDFFAIVEPGYKQAFIENLDWLESIHPIGYCFQNSPDGYKLMFEDGIFCEFAVFEPDELAHIPFAAGRVVWKQPWVDEAVAFPQMPIPAGQTSPVEWLVGEAVTNLYVGLGRYRRGEKLSAARFIQNYAVDRVLELAARIEVEQPAFKDQFSGERRFEQRFPELARQLPQFMTGYEGSPQSALAILEFLECHFEVDPQIAAAIRDLCAD
jgi:lincosamide nucleotidyltransferase B/F